MADSPTRAARLDAALADLLASCPEIEAAAVVSHDGLPMAAALPVSLDEEHVAAMSAALLSLGEKVAEGLGRGDLAQVSVEAEAGGVHLVGAADSAVLVAVTHSRAKTGLVLFELRRVAEQVTAIFGPEPPQPVQGPASAIRWAPSSVETLPTSKAATTTAGAARAAVSTTSIQGWG